MLFAAAGISLSLYVLSFFMPAQTFSPIVMVWKEGFRVLAEVAFWLTAYRFGAFSGKSRVLTAVLAVQAVGLLGTAGLTGFVTKHPVFLILGASFSAVAAAFSLKALIDNGSAPIAHRFSFDKQKIKKRGSDSLQRNLSRCFFISSGLLFFAAGIFQYYFLISAAEFSIGEPKILMKIYGTIFAGTAVVIIGALYLFAKSRLSLFAALFLFPIALLVMSVGGWSVLFGFLIAAQAIFGLANGAREATLQIVPLAVSLRTGFRETLFRKSVIEPVALALSGLFLLTIEQNATTEIEFLYFMTGLSVVVALTVIAVRKAYLTSVLNMLKTHLWRGGKLLLAGKGINAYLEESLKASDSQNVLYALRVIEESSPSMFSKYLKQALHHANEDVRLYALSEIEELRLSEALADVAELAETDESAKVRRNAVRVMCRAGGSEEREKAVCLIDDPILRDGALTGLLAVGREGVFVAIKRIADLSVSPDKNDRLSAATVLGDAGNAAFYHPLTTLLSDTDFDVCKAALNAAGKLVNPLLLPAVMETFRYPELREAAADTLLQFKETALKEIDAVLISDKYPIQFRVLLTRLTARIASPAAEEFLFNHIQIEDRRIRFNIIKALSLAGYKATGKKINIVRLCLYDEMETATGILAAMHVFSKNKNEELNAPLDILKTALNGEIEYIKERILLLLSLLFPSKPLADLLSKYNPAKPEDEITVKIADKLLSGELRMLCLPLFENKTLQQRLALLRPQFYPPVLSVNGHIQDILKTPAGELTDWTRACAAYAAGSVKDIMFTDALTTLLSDADAIVRETAVWALGKILPCEEAARLISGNLEDSSVYVARMTRFVIDGSGQMVL